jgi:hypothetical protein
MSTILKWLCAKQDKKWRVATMLFFASWNFMTIYPTLLLLNKVWGRDRMEDGLYREIWWTYVIAWSIGSLFVIAMFTHLTRLSDRIALMEKALNGQSPDDLQSDNGDSN